MRIIELNENDPTALYHKYNGQACEDPAIEAAMVGGGS